MVNSGDLNQSIQKQFGSAAENYTFSRVHQSGPDLDAMLECVELSTDMRVLDVGCGAGHTSMAFAPHVKNVVAYDLTSQMLEQVERNANAKGIENISTSEGSAEEISHDKQTFDLVVSRYSAHHWNHPDLAMAEFARILKPNGKVIIGDVIAPEDYAQDTFLQTFELIRDPSHVRDYSISQWLKLMADAGFRPQLVEQFEIEIHFQSWVQRINTPELNVQMLESLFANATDEVRRLYHLPENRGGNLTLPVAVILGELGTDSE